MNGEFPKILLFENFPLYGSYQLGDNYSTHQKKFTFCTLPFRSMIAVRYLPYPHCNPVP